MRIKETDEKCGKLMSETENGETINGDLPGLFLRKERYRYYTTVKKWNFNIRYRYQSDVNIVIEFQESDFSHIDNKR